MDEIGSRFRLKKTGFDCFALFLKLDPLAQDPSVFRSLLYFPHEQKAYYGAEAIKQYIENDSEGRLFRSFKSHLPNPNYLGTAVGNRILPISEMVA